MLLSLIVPCYNEQEALPVFYRETAKVLASMDCDCELLLINDGSRDNTLAVMKELAAADPRVLYFSFSRNFGKEAAPVRSWFARRFYSLINRISDADIVDGARDFRLMTREMKDAILSMSEYNRFSKGIFGWVGFKTCWLPFENVERVAGQTKWSFWGLMKYAIDGIISFSQAPLDIASWFGFLMTGISFLMLIFIVVRRLIFGDPVAGWASTICVIIFIGGLQLFCLGIMGQYLAKTYMEVKNRPHYIISETNAERAEKIR